jgi:hypothetical protein
MFWWKAAILSRAGQKSQFVQNVVTDESYSKTASDTVVFILQILYEVRRQ